MQREFATLQRAPQAFLDGLALDGAQIHRGFKKTIGLPAAFLGLIHGSVGVFQQRLGFGAVVGVDADADAGRDVKLMFLDQMGVRHGLEQSFRGDGDILGVGDFREQHDEFVAALPADRIRTAYTAFQAAGDRLQELVADRVAERIIDVLEAIEVETEHRDVSEISSFQGDRLRDAIIQ